jgi:nitrogen fixation/metabolism regulation signal transduction histidine kinase
MISIKLYYSILIRVLLIVILSLLFSFFVFIVKSLHFSFITALAVLFVTINLISYLNTVNKKIGFFFNSVRNDDSTLSFSMDEKNSIIRDLYSNMNKVNQQIKHLKIENRNQEQYFRILLEELAVGIITYDKKGFIIHANSSAKRLLSTDMLFHLQQIDRIDKNLFREISSIKPSERRLVALKTLQGETELSLKATSFKTNNTEMVILSIQDIKNELDEKEIQSWMKLIRVLMHEIMNSITPITSLSESLFAIYSKDGLPVSPEKVNERTITSTLQGLNVIKEQGKGLMSFVESYRKLTRIPDPEKKSFKVADLLSRVKVLYDSLEKSDTIKLSFSLTNPDLEITADQNLISQVLLNLIKNAIEANEENPSGMIRVIAGVDKDYRPEICVIDNGPGISEAILDQIFVPFFTTRENGSGIGLSISRQIMRVHGGNLKVRSVPSNETVFCLNF